MSPRLEQLRAEVRAHAHNRPGTYRMLGPSGEVLYVGKSVHVRTRLLSYFRAERGEKAAEIIGHAHALKWDYAPSEFAALLEEFRSIKRWRPVYNVEHKGDRSYCFIKLTREPVPRLLVVRQVASDGAHYYGPFRGRAGAEDAVRALSDLLELRDCAADTPMRLADQLPLLALPPQSPAASAARCTAASPPAPRAALAPSTARAWSRRAASSWARTRPRSPCCASASAPPRRGCSSSTRRSCATGPSTWSGCRPRRRR
ncbi:MAG TPA: hypothetical protein VFO83_05345 [Aggregicoccus sp.]|nr:hypothetical protein [Aggregicoccus sp.]